jgi:DNA-directed RNA polymerase specialized sigma24 family protein
MTRIAINEALQSFRRQDRRRIAYGSYDFDTFASPYESPCQSLANLERTQTLESAVATLPANYRQVLILRDFEELSEKETALSLHFEPDGSQNASQARETGAAREVLVGERSGRQKN